METEHYSQTPLSQKNGSQPQSLPLVYTAQPYENDEDEIDLGQLFAIVRRRAVVIAGTAIAVTSAALIWGLLQTPKYQGKFRLLVEPLTADETQIVGQSAITQTLLGKGAGIPESGLDYETQIEVLQSPKLMSRIIEQIQARYPDIRYDSLIGEGDEKLKVERLGATKIIEVSYQDPDPEKTQFVIDQIANAYIRYSLQERQTNLGQGIKFVDQQLPRVRRQVDTLQAQIQAFRQRNNLIDLDTQGEQLSERTNELEGQQLAAQSDLKQTRALYTTLQQRLGLQPTQVISSSALGQAPRYQKLLNQLQNIDTRIAVESARFQQGSPVIQDLQDQRQNLLPLLNREARKVLGNNLSSATVDLSTQTSDSTQTSENSIQASGNSIRLKLAQQFVDAANQIHVLEVRNQAIAQAKSLLDRQVQQLPATARRYTDLERELKVATDTLNQLLVRREALRIDDAQQDVPWEVIAAPEIPQDDTGKLVPESRPIPLALGVGVFLGLLSGLGAALIAELLNGVFHSPEEVKTKTGLTPLGVIPLNQALPNPTRSEQTSLNWRHNASPFLEAFDALNTHVRFLNSDRLSRSLVVSSAMPRDGKSTVAVHLAQAAAEMGQRVLLVDADLRHPQIQTLLNLPNSQGLTTLMAADVEAYTVIQRSHHVSNFFVLTAGQAATNSTVLLGSKKMQDLMQQLQAEFDLVIYDAPSILSSTDTSLIAPSVDGVIFVVRIGQTGRSRSVQALERLKTVHAQVLGFVANGVKQPTDYGPSMKNLHPHDSGLKAMKFFN